MKKKQQMFGVLSTVAHLVFPFLGVFAQIEWNRQLDECALMPAEKKHPWEPEVTVAALKQYVANQRLGELTLKPKQLVART